jgi:phospholipid transport system substrate-binding protein
MMRRFYCLPLFIVVTVALFSPENSAAGEATDAVKGTADQVLAVLKSSGAAGGKLRPETRERLKSLVSERFDFNEMAKRSLGSHWARQSPEDQKEFAKRFTDLLINSYSDTLAAYRGEKIRYLDESGDGGFARVNTVITNSKGENFKVDYSLHRAGGDWKVYDVIIEDVSLVNNYRSQFARILSKNSFAELLDTMKTHAVSAPGT